MKRFGIIIFLIALGCASIATAPPSFAQGGVIRDTEIENTIRVYISPLFKAAGLEANRVSIHILNDHNLNAFVAGGQKIFIHSGLLMRAKTPGQVIGVLAHEIGHITGGHLARLQQRLKDANNQSILALVFGGALALATQSPDALVAGASAGSNIGQRAFLSYTRTMEQSADQAALNYLDTIGQSARGFHDFLTILLKEEKTFTTVTNRYTRSHPMSTDRLVHVKEHLRSSRATDLKINPKLDSMHHRMRGKLKGFINPPDVTLREFKPDDSRIGTQYARAIALSKTHETNAAIAIVDRLIADSPEDPFLHELKGDLLVDAGHPLDALAPYKNALTILPWASLIKVVLAQLLLESDDPLKITSARAHLLDALNYEPDLTRAWRLLATAEGKLGNTGAASLALAEEALLRSDNLRAVNHAKRAQNRLRKGSPEWFRAQDIEISSQRSNKN